MVCIQSRLQNLLIILTSRARCQTGPTLECPCGLYSQGFMDRGPSKWTKDMVEHRNGEKGVPSKGAKLCKEEDF